MAVSKSIVRAEAEMLDVGTPVCLGKFPFPIRWFGVRDDPFDLCGALGRDVAF